MERLTTISDNQIRVKGVRQGVFQDQEAIDNAFTKLAAYENLGSVEEIKLLKQNYDIQSKDMVENWTDINPKIYSSQMHELEVYKKALKIADLEIEGMKEYLLEKAQHELEVCKRALDSTSNILEQKYMFAQDDKTRKIIPLNEYFLEKARKELEDER